MKKFQIFVHNHYESIKLILLIIAIGLGAFAVIQRIEDNNRQAEDRAAVVKTVLDTDRNVTKAINAKVDEQTAINNRQFRALCILIIETAGQKGLDKLDPDSRARCEQLADDPTAETSGMQSSPQLNQNQSPSQIDNSSSSNNTPPAPQQELPQSPTPEEPPKSILPFIDEPIIGCPLGICI